MTLRTKLEIAAGIVLLLLAALGFRAWMDDHDARLQLKSQLEAAEKVKGQLDSDISSLKRDIQAHNEQTDKAVAAIDAQSRAITNAQQSVAFLQKVAPQLQAKAAPDAPSSVLVDAVAQGRYSSECEQCKLRLKQALDDNDKLKEVETKLTEKNKQTEGELRDANNAVKGGTKFQRFKRSLKYIGIGAAIGAAAGYAAHR